jgi:predicted GNAT family acetyltransferase
MPEVMDNRAASRFELAQGGALAHLDYRREAVGDGDRVRVVLVHTEVPAELSGQGVGSALARGALDRLRAEGGGVRVVPVCEFVAAFIKRHPEYRDLVADG